MILAFKWQFKEKILDGSKIHTIRRDNKNRWNRGNIIYFTNETCSDINNYFKIGECINTQKIEIMQNVGLTIKVDDKYISKDQINSLFKNDGFDDLIDFLIFFNKNYGQHFTGKIIHWTDFKY